MPLLLMLSLSLAIAKDCPSKSGKYGAGNQYQDMFCRMFISADRTDSKSYRNFTFTDEGLIQVFSNFPGTTNSNSTGARVYYLFPLREEKSIKAADENHLSVIHPSGVEFRFDQAGRVSSSELKMKVSKEINSQNKSGVEIQSYSRGLVVDLGYRMGNTPTLNKNGPVTITDKNLKSCKLINNDINIVNKDKVELRYKTNVALHDFLSKKCPGLDLSDLVESNTNSENVKTITRHKSIGSAPLPSVDLGVNDSQRGAKPQEDSLGSFINSMEKNETGTRAK